MALLGKILAAHPLDGLPYDKLEFVRFDRQGVPLYYVTETDHPPSGAYEALGRAFREYGGQCFYCPTRFKPQKLSNGRTRAHRDHVIAASKGGSKHLHNLVIACGKCGQKKANGELPKFQVEAASRYLGALSSHVAACLAEGHQA